MSGILAVVRTDGSPPDARNTARAFASLESRGPDGRRVETLGQTALAHARLAIQDGRPDPPQPLTLDGSLWISAFLRLDDRETLARRLGVSLPTDDPGDGGIVLLAYRRWGLEMTEHLLGDFCFVLWDARHQRLVAARDHFGVRPLYYARTATTLLVGNSLAALREDPELSEDFDEDYLADFLLFGASTNPAATAYSAVRSVPPGHLLVWERSGLRLHRYWRLPIEAPLDPRGRDAFPEELAERLSRAVADRLGVGPVSVLMSGGLDSTSVAALAHRRRPGSVAAFTATATTLWADHEGDFARQVGAFCGFPVHLCPADDSLLFGGWHDRAPPLPVADPLWARFVDHCGAIVARGRVALTGHGGDSGLRPSGASSLSALPPRWWWSTLQELARWTRRHHRPPPLGLRSILTGRDGGWSPPFPTWIEPEAMQRLRLHERWQAVHGPEARSAGVGTGGRLRSLRDEARRDLTSPIWPNVFWRHDAEALSLPLDVRHPWFDLRVVRYLAGVPSFPWCLDKEILRRAMVGILAEPVRRRAKSGATRSPVSSLILRETEECWRRHLEVAEVLEGLVVLEDLRRVVEARERLLEHEMPWITRPLCLGYWLAASTRR